MLVAILEGACLGYFRVVDGLQAVAGEVLVGEIFEGVDAIALPETLKLFLYFLVLVDLFFVGGLHVLHLFCQLHQLQFYGLLALLLIMVLHQQLLLITLCVPQFLLQLSDHLFLLINQTHQSIVTLLDILALLQQSIVGLAQLILLTGYSFHLLVGLIQQVLQLLLIFAQPLIQLRIFLNPFEDVPADALIFIDLLPDEVQLTGQLPIFLGQLHLKLLIIPQGLHQLLNILPKRGVLLLRVLQLDGQGPLLLLEQLQRLLASHHPQPHQLQLLHALKLLTMQLFVGQREAEALGLEELEVFGELFLGLVGAGYVFVHVVLELPVFGQEVGVHVELLVALSLQAFDEVQVVALGLAELPYRFPLLLEQGLQLYDLLLESLHVALCMEQFLLAPLVLLNLLKKEVDDLNAFDLLQFVVDGGVLPNELRVTGGKGLRLVKAARPVDLPLPGLLLPQLMLLLIE